jgi:hypothetical protein
MKKFAVLFALVAAPFSLSPALAGTPEGSSGTISVYAGGAFMRQYYDDCGYYANDCSGYYDRSNTYTGPEFGVDARIITSSGLLFDLSAEHARVADYGDAFLEQQFTAGVGYEGRVGRGSRWYAEGFYQYYQLGEDFNGCNYSCNGWYKANGGGVKGGFSWPFANRFFGTVNLRASYLAGKDSGEDLVQAKLDGSVGYMITDNFSVALGASSQAIEEAHDRRYYDNSGYPYNRSDDTFSHTSVSLQLAVHF